MIFAVLAALTLASAGCEDSAEPGDTPGNDGASAPDDASSGDASSGDTASGDTASGDAGPGDGGGADDADTAPAGDTASGDGADGGDTTDPAVQLIHRPPHCSPSTQTCSLQVSTETQTGLKAQVLRNQSGVQGVTVVFAIESGGNHASLGSRRVQTGPMGRAGVQFQTGSSTGEVRVRAKVRNRKAAPIYWDVTVN